MNLPHFLFPPRRQERRPGRFRSESPVIRAAGPASILAPAAAALRDAGLELAIGEGEEKEFTARMGQPSRTLIDKATAAWVRLLADAGPDRFGQAFCLAVDESGIAMSAGGNSGLLYGLLYLAEAWDDGLEFGIVADWPEIERRCALLDLSRGRVPRLSFLDTFIDLLATLRYNQLTFNLEHVLMPFAGDPAEADAVTPDEIAAIDRMCRDRGIEYIPFQQSLGHLRGILRRPEYRHLAYDPQKLWSIDPANEGSYQLLGMLYDRQAAVTSSTLFHAGCDEPFDMMRSFDRARYGGRAREEVIVDHIARVARMLTERGRRPMVWADALPSSPELLGRLPDDLILCQWHYGTGNLENADHYRQKLTGPNRPFYACATTWSFVKLFPDLANLRASNDGLFTAAKERGPMGMMTTIWGDLGHMNLPGLEVYPLAYGARHGWSAEPADEDFSAPLTRLVSGRRGKSIGALALILDGLNQSLRGQFGLGGVGELALFAEPFSTAPLPAGFKCDRAAGGLATTARYAAVLLARLEADGSSGRQFWLDHHLTVVQAEYLAKKFSAISALLSVGTDPAAFRSLADQCGEAAVLLARGLALLESRWLANHKRSGFDVNAARWQRLIRAWHDRQREFSGYAADLTAGRAIPDAARILSTPPAGYNFDLLAETGLKDLIT